jgi:hypothetical protein
MRSSQTSNRQGQVVKAHQRENPDPLKVASGEELLVSDRSDPWQGNPDWIWVWCTDPRGRSAWAPADLLEPIAGQGLDRATARYDYDAVELSVAVGDHLLIDGEKNGWYWCRSSQAESGWVPMDHIELMED